MPVENALAKNWYKKKLTTKNPGTMQLSPDHKCLIRMTAHPSVRVPTGRSWGHNPRYGVFGQVSRKGDRLFFGAFVKYHIVSYFAGSIYITFIYLSTSSAAV